MALKATRVTGPLSPPSCPESVAGGRRVYRRSSRLSQRRIISAPSRALSPVHTRGLWSAAACLPPRQACRRCIAIGFAENPRTRQATPTKRRVASMRSADEHAPPTSPQGFARIPAPRRMTHHGNQVWWKRGD